MQTIEHFLRKALDEYMLHLVKIDVRFTELRGMLDAIRSQFDGRSERRPHA